MGELWYGYTVLVSIVGFIMVFWLTISAMKAFYKCSCYMRKYWCTCCHSDSNNNMEILTLRTRPKFQLYQVKHCSTMVAAGKNSSTYSTFVLPSYNKVRTHFGEPGEPSFLNEISSSDDDDDSSGFLTYGSQSPLNQAMEPCAWDTMV